MAEVCVVLEPSLASFWFVYLYLVYLPCLMTITPVVDMLQALPKPRTPSL